MSGSIPNSILPHLNEIAGRLWSGHAAVMVGAGFSKNATPLGDDCKGFPDWNRLGEVFYEKTRGENISDGRFLNVLKLADEVQASFGRPMLHQLLRDCIPDEEYEPSKLYEKLLNLPWTDVLTTNYDTLLERAARSVTEHNYQLVVNSQSLIYSEKPRIIKLHGSFPCEEPFIITEEDYRRYPTDFAPFVNTVQQSLLENTLCLIGFSGDDPNFLRWIGWIRDNLGENNSPKIYLIGVLNLTKAQSSLLAKYNIIPIDVSEIDGVGKSDHYKGIETFFEFCLGKKEASENLDWLKDRPETVYKRPPSLPVEKASSSSVDTSTLGGGEISPTKPLEKQIKKVLPEWREQRESYPDWVIVPEDRRTQLWYQTQSWEGAIKSVDDISAEYLLDFLYEYLWRIEKCLCPIWDPNVELIEYVLKHGSEYIKREKEGLTNTEIFSSNSLKEIKEKCCYIQLSYLRYLREEGKVDTWKVNEKRAKLFVYQTNEVARYNYEKALFRLFEFNIKGLEKVLDDWKVVPSQPFWSAKKAGLLAEIGKVDEAVSLLSGALRAVRDKLNLKPVTSNYSEVSQESYILVLLRYVQNAINFLQRDPYEEQADYSERWNYLKQYKCDPWNELKLLESTLVREVNDAQSSNHDDVFDLNRHRGNVYVFAQDRGRLEAFRLLKFLEDVGIPLRVKNNLIVRDSIYGAIERLHDSAPYWCMTTMLRLGDSKAVNKIFNRRSLYGMKQSEVSPLILNYIRMFEESVLDKELSKSTRSVNLKKVIPEALSRLVTKSSDDNLCLIFKLLKNIARTDDLSGYEGLDKFVRRLVESLSEKNAIDYIPALLDLPIVDTGDFISSREMPNPFNYLGHLRPELIEIPEGFLLDEKNIQRLIDCASGDSKGQRVSSILTLYVLKHLKLLTDNQLTMFKSAVFSKVDSDGFPIETSLYRFALMRELSPKPKEGEKTLRNYILQQEFPAQADSAEKGVSISGGFVYLCHEICGASEEIEWTQGEAREIVHKVVRWWDKDKGFLNKTQQVKDEFRKRFIGINNVLSRVAVCFSSIEEKEHNLLVKMRDEMSCSDLPVFSITAAFSPFIDEWEAKLVDDFHLAYLDTREEFIEDAVEGIYTICERGRFDDVLQSCLRLIANTLLLRDKVRLLKSILLVRRLILKYSDAFSGDIEGATLFALDRIRLETEKISNESDIKDLLFIREHTARLAHDLYRKYMGANSAIPDCIKGWEQVCNSPDEFIEIRNAWPT
ncbi:SIR2 family protein [Vibrio brasiliensis]|uniref:SIR2 family NAD-dependent protein deacylase n=1 Tax=Vibrio brasiliensis TaxID=170652 RepID=UPI001EFCC113|nr:SIR2 family protein [Vibrio brasiliensis]MCG9782623.1 SIR2 family protein [Vibrio brasiliensis]